MQSFWTATEEQGKTNSGVIFRYNLKYARVLYLGTAATVKFSLTYPVFTQTIQNSGSSRHNKILQEANEGKVQ